MKSSNEAPKFWPIVLCLAFMTLMGSTAFVLLGAAVNVLISLELGLFLFYFFLAFLSGYATRKFYRIHKTVSYNFALDELMYQVQTGKEMSDYSKKVLVRDDEDEEKRNEETT